MEGGGGILSNRIGSCAPFNSLCVTAIVCLVSCSVPVRPTLPLSQLHRVLTGGRIELWNIQREFFNFFSGRWLETDICEWIHWDVLLNLRSENVSPCVPKDKTTINNLILFSLLPVAPHSISVEGLRPRLMRCSTRGYFTWLPFSKEISRKAVQVF